MLLAKQLYFYSGSIISVGTDGLNTNFVNAVRHVCRPFEYLLIKGKIVRSEAIRDYGFTIGYFAKAIPDKPDDLDTHSPCDLLRFEILGTHDALSYIFPEGNNRPFNGYEIRVQGVIPMGLTEESDYHAKEMLRMKDWMRDIYQKNLVYVSMGRCDHDE